MRLSQGLHLLQFVKSFAGRDRIFDETMQPTGLRGTQFTQLAVLCLAGPATVNRLAKEKIMNRTTLAQNLKPLEAQSLVRIVPGEDKRTRTLSITLKEEKAFIKAPPYWEEAQSHAIEHLSMGDPHAETQGTGPPQAAL